VERGGEKDPEAGISREAFGERECNRGVNRVIQNAECVRLVPCARRRPGALYSCMRPGRQQCARARITRFAFCTIRNASGLEERLWAVGKHVERGAESVERVEARGASGLVPTNEEGRWQPPCAFRCPSLSRDSKLNGKFRADYAARRDALYSCMRESRKA